MSEFVSKPYVVEAVRNSLSLDRFKKDENPEIIKFLEDHDIPEVSIKRNAGYFVNYSGRLVIPTNVEHATVVWPGDWILVDDGQILVLSDELFRRYYLEPETAIDHIEKFVFPAIKDVLSK